MSCGRADDQPRAIAAAAPAAVSVVPKLSGATTTRRVMISQCKWAPTCRPVVQRRHADRGDGGPRPRAAASIAQARKVKMPWQRDAEDASAGSSDRRRRCSELRVHPSIRVHRGQADRRRSWRDARRSAVGRTPPMTRAGARAPAQRDAHHHVEGRAEGGARQAARTAQRGPRAPWPARRITSSPSDRGPVRRYVRNIVDSRRNFAGLFTPLALVFIVLVYALPQYSALVSIALLLFVVMVVVDCVYVGRWSTNASRNASPIPPTAASNSGGMRRRAPCRCANCECPSHRSSAAKRSDRPCEHWSWAASGRGSSAHAESLLAGLGTVRYVATGPIAVDDDEWAARVAPSTERAGPRRTRPLDDRCCGGAARAPRRRGTGRRPWQLGRGPRGLGGPADDTAFDEALAQLCAALREHRADIVVVSPEVGLSVVPETSAGRRFPGLDGTGDQAVAEAVDGPFSSSQAAWSRSPILRHRVCRRSRPLGRLSSPTDTAAPVDEAVAAAVVTPRPPSHHR